MSRAQIAARLKALRKARKIAKARLRLHRHFALLETGDDAFLAEVETECKNEIAAIKAQIVALKKAALEII